MACANTANPGKYFAFRNVSLLIGNGLDIFQTVNMSSTDSMKVVNRFLKGKDMWYSFSDSHSGGGRKTDFETILIETDSEEQAISVFFSRFGRNPEKVTCSCCGPDFNISDEEMTLDQATGFDRGCESVYLNSDGNEVLDDVAWTQGKGINPGFSETYLERQSTHEMAWNKYISLSEYLEKSNVFVLYAVDISENEKNLDVPEQGYIWHD